MGSGPRLTIGALILTLTALLSFFFGVSVLTLGALTLTPVATGGVILGTALLAALVISLGVITNRAVLGDAFGTTGTLTAFSSLEHPLIIRLQQEAPGTYHHSVAVASLAEAAARAVGADATLARIGSYYHDIGKLRSPELFIENINPKDDPHHHMEPIDSARIIIGHVIDGIQIAKEAGLPEEVINFIPEHTGTTLVYFFYSKAKQSAKRGQEVHKRDFRYPGPKPMSKETAIVMLADTVEAAVRAYAPQTDDELQGAIAEVVQEKIDDTQLAISGLSTSDIPAVKAAFFTVLQRMHHKRVKYPRRGAVRSDDSEA